MRNFPLELHVDLSNYSNVRSFGSSGFSEVFLDRNDTMNEKVAVKVLFDWDPLIRYFQEFVRHVERALFCVLGIRLVR
jgi:hypothetical protein